jgi:N-methylhydantoinase A
VQSVRLNSAVPAGTLRGYFAQLERTAREKFRAQGGSGPPTLTRSIAMRYEGQNYEQEMEIAAGAIGEDELREVLARYHEQYEAFYGYSLEGLTVEFVRLVVTAIALAAQPLPDLSLDVRGRTQSGRTASERTAHVHFGTDGFCATTVMSRDELVGVGERPGPIVVEAVDTTIVVPPGWRVRSDEVGILELLRSGGDAGESGAELLAAAPGGE